ncbi:MAG TPA: ZIP family metal transporter [Nanoarchaeota archaeon]|nr:ZIP family metal transporter [Nanoarchaeota archaeon]
MDSVWLYSMASVAAVSLLSLIGIISLGINIGILRKTVLFMVSFSTGALFGDAFIHLLPEAFENYGFGLNVSFSLLSGVLLFFVIEKFIHWHHCHLEPTMHHPHPFAYMNLFGDSVHNFIDGLIIGSSYLVSIPVGIATTLAVILHEIPQEIGDFGVLLHGGFSVSKALAMNFLTALTAFLGAILALVMGGSMPAVGSFLVPFAAGGFLYIAGSDLIPELHKEVGWKKSAMQLLMIILGIAVMCTLLLLE